MKIVRTIAALSVFITQAVLFGCSPNGGGIGGTGKTESFDSGLIVGVVDGFGSIVINDSRYETDNAIVFIDGIEADLADIKLGMKVTAKVSPDDSTASEIHYQPNASGPIEAVNLNAGYIEVFGNRILIDDQTVFDELVPAELVNGLSVEVSGDRNSDNEIIARYITRASNSDSIFATGSVLVSEDGAQLLVAGLEIDFTAAAASLGLTLEQFADAFLVPGTVVRISPTDPQEKLDGADGADAVNGNAGHGSDGGDAVNGNAGDGGDGGHAVNGNAGDGGNGGNVGAVANIEGSGGGGSSSNFVSGVANGEGSDVQVSGVASSQASWSGSAAVTGATASITINGEQIYFNSGATAFIVTSVKNPSVPVFNTSDFVQVLGTIATKREAGVFTLDGFTVEMTETTQVLTAFGQPAEMSLISEDQTVLITGIAQNSEGDVVARTVKLLTEF
jgi:hypothetical protein